VTVKYFVEFRQNATLPLESKGVATTCRVERGAQCAANVRCYVAYRSGRYVEVADIELREGMLRGVPRDFFLFIDLMD
jgi:hypothetical protein